MNAPRVILSNGLCIVNFSSPHAFDFEDGAVLEGCSPERSKSLSLEAVEVVSENPRGFQDISLSFRMTTAVREELERLENDPTVDVILCPLPVLIALKGSAAGTIGKARTVRMADRVTKSACIGKFCC